MAHHCPKCGFHSESRTEQQNRLLWAGAYTPIAQFMSEQSGKVITRDMVHEVCKSNFSPRVENRINGETYPKSTTRLSKREFSEYMDRVYQFGAEMGVWFNTDEAA